MIITVFFTIFGMLIWRYRLSRLEAEAYQNIAIKSVLPTVSIIVPARNEEKNLPKLLSSIAQLSYKPLEVIVVDDHSTDSTADIARKFYAHVIIPPPLPPEWIGKSWACHAGAQQAKGDYLLFTDADTCHSPDSLAKTLSAALAHNADLTSVIPRHRAEAFWEKLQGAFHLLLYIATKAGFPPAKTVNERSFAIGQYLLFKRTSYNNISGHASVCGRVAEDLALQREIRVKGGYFHLCTADNILEVRMYPDGFKSFLAGWRRSFREGIRSAGLGGILEITIIIGWLLGLPIAFAKALSNGNPTLALGWFVAMVHAVTFIGRYQRLVGKLPWWGVFGAPLMLAAFVLVSFEALWDHLTNAPVVWRGRVIPQPKQGRSHTA